MRDIANAPRAPSPHDAHATHSRLYDETHPSRHHFPRDPPDPAISTTSSKLISTRNIRPSAVPLPPPTALISPQLTNFSHASRATSLPQTRPGVAAAPEIDADVFADVNSRTYSAYAAGNDSASGARLVGCADSALGSYSAARRVAASSSERGSEDGLAETVVAAEKGSGTGSGQERLWVLNVAAVGTWRDGTSS